MTLRDLCDQRTRELPEWEEWNRTAVVELGEILRHQPPELLVEDPRVGLMQLDELIAHQSMETISRERAVWVESRVHAFVALYLIVKFDGHWLVDNDPESPAFSRYVVSVQHHEADEAVALDVGRLVHEFLYRSPLRSLSGLLTRLEISLATGFPAARTT